MFRNSILFWIMDLLGSWNSVLVSVLESRRGRFLGSLLPERSVIILRHCVYVEITRQTPQEDMLGTRWAFLDEAEGEIPAWWAQSLEVVHMHPASFPLWLFLFQGLSVLSSSVLHLLFLWPAFELVFVCFLKI